MAPKVEPSTPKVRFQDGEKVLCFHGPLMYEAKCLKSRIKEKEVNYFIHYSGWNKSWDEWVLESRVLKYNEANLQRREDLKNQLNSSKNNRAKKLKTGKESTGSKEKDAKKYAKVKAKSEDPDSSPVTESSQESGGSAFSSQESGTVASTSGENRPNKKKKTRSDLNVETEDSFNTRLEVKIVIPDLLKAWLVDDWDMITRQKKLVQLPTHVTVDQILANYITYKSTAKGNPPYKETVVKEVIDGIKEYFNVMLGNQLLYRFERPQYGEILAEKEVGIRDFQASGTYGAIHLIRLFVRMGGILIYSNLDEKHTQVVQAYIHDILKYITKNAVSLLSQNDYAIATAEYIRRALI